MGFWLDAHGKVCGEPKLFYPIHEFWSFYVS